MRGLALCILVVLLFTGCASAEPKQPALETDEQKTMYAMGVRLAGVLAGREFSESEIEYIKMGLADGILGVEPRVDTDAIAPKVNTMLAVRATQATKKEKAAGEAFCEEMAQVEGARRTASGAIYIEIEPGDGPTPAAGDTVRVHYHGTLRDGKVFDSSVDRNQPATFNVDRVVPCFSDGLREMKVGGKAKLVCPSETAYGDRGSRPHIKPGAALVFEVELLEIVEQAAPAEPATP
jgi:FKBP-type peptidyl-prolyl cis-trans isomerase FkpA/FKBP-type peptidyl-prolyl cis-trans isomerase FklB